MSNQAWQEFLATQGAYFDAGTLVNFKDQAAASGNVVTDLSYLSLIEVTGSGSEVFLNGQFTTNIKLLCEGHAQFSSWCNPKGQTRSTFIIYCHEGVFHILLPSTLAIDFIRQLSVYILQTDVKLVDKSNELIRVGVHISDQQLLQQMDVISSELDVVCVQLQQKGDGYRYVLAADLNTQKNIWQQLTVDMVAVGSNIWGMLDMQAGYAWLTPKTTEKFLPQMLGMQRIAGLDYQKGCYPGQEIIARLHFRGQLKHYLYLAICVPVQTPQSGDCVYMGEEKKNVGTVLNAQQVDGQYYLLVVISKDAINDELRLQDDAVLSLQAFSD